MRKSFLLLSAVALLITASCSSGEPVESQPVVNSTPRFVISLKSAGESDKYWTLVQSSALAKAQEIGAELVTSTATDAQTQVKELEDQIAKGANGLAVVPIDAKALIGVQKKAQEANIPLILVETQENLPDFKVVGTDEEAAGRLAADYVCNPESGILVNENGFTARNSEVAIIKGSETDIIGTVRAKGGRWGLEDCNLKVVDEASGNNDEAAAESLTSEIITKYPNVKLFLVTDDVMAIGAAKAVKAAGKNGEIIIVSFGATPQMIEAVIGGDITATIAPNPEIIGARSVESLHMLLDEQSIPDRYDTGTRLVTIQNASQFR